MKRYLQVLLPIGLLAAISFVSIQAGIIQAIIPQAVPTPNKRGNSSVFQLAADSTTAAAGTAFCDDGNGNTTTAGCNVASSSAFSAITSGTNTKAGMVVGAGATLATASTGTLFANGIRAYTVATLPGSPSTGMQAYVTDGANSLDCFAGAGASTVLCGWTGSVWAPESGGGSGALLSGGTDPGVPAVPTIVQSASVNAGGSSGSLAYTSNVTAGHISIAAVSCESATPTGLAFTDSFGTAYVSRQGSQVGVAGVYIFSGPLLSSGPDTVSFSAGAGTCSLFIAEMAGSNGVVDVSVAGGASAVTTLTTSDLIIGGTYLASFNSTAVAPTVALQTQHEGGNNQMLLALPTTAPGSYSIATTGSWNAISVVAFRPIPVTSPGVNGSFYLNTKTGVLWGPKAAGSWSQSGLSLISTSGANNQLVLGVVPVSVTSCGTTPSIVTGSTNTAGTINIGAGVSVTACTLNFGTPTFASTPSCRVNTNSTVSLGDVSSVSTSSVTFSLSATLGGGQLYYSCF